MLAIDRMFKSTIATDAKQFFKIVGIPHAVRPAKNCGHREFFTAQAQGLHFRAVHIREGVLRRL